MLKLKNKFGSLRVNPCDVFLWGFLKKKVFQKGPENVAQLRAHIVKLCRALSGDLSKSCDECKGSFARGCEVKWCSHWTCSSLGTIFHLMRTNSLSDLKWFYNNNNVLCVQSMVWHFVHHPVYSFCFNCHIYLKHTKMSY